LQYTKRHILILSSWYPNRLDPFLGNFVHRFAIGLSQNNDVTVLHTRSDASIPTIKELEVVRTEQGALKTILLYHPKGRNILQTYRYQHKAFKLGLSMLDKPDLIFGHVMLPRGMQFLEAKRKFNCPLIVLEHGSYFRPELSKKRSILEKLILKKLSRKIDVLAAVSNFLKKDLLKEFPDKHIEVIPNPVNLELFHVNPKLPRHIKEFLHVSTMDPQVKNPKGIIDACALLKQLCNANFHLTIVSDEDYRTWQQYVAELNLDRQITFQGPLKNEELVSFYQNADAFILFSSYETFSIVLAESWACGTPIISTPVGIGANLPPELGIQIEIGNTTSLANAMHQIVVEEVQYNAETIRQKAEGFSEKKVIQDIEHLISTQLTHV
jgi:glycosyltransferase involved in cell wall biosynthesis